VGGDRGRVGAGGGEGADVTGALGHDPNSSAELGHVPRPGEDFELGGDRRVLGRPGRVGQIPDATDEQVRAGLQVHRVDAFDRDPGRAEAGDEAARNREQSLLYAVHATAPDRQNSSRGSLQ